jgi:hypothetical protein
MADREIGGARMPDAGWLLGVAFLYFAKFI